MSDLITLRYELHEGDVTSHFLVPMPKVGICEVLRVDFVDGQWEVTNPEAQPEWGWIGKHSSRQIAILEYLKRRLGMPEEEQV
jgi:hypothetical protein